MSSPLNPRIILAGSVNSSHATLIKLANHKMNVVGVLGLHPELSSNISGFRDLREVALINNYEFKYFSKINDEEVVQFVKEKEPDYLFVIGLSQMVHKPLLEVSNHGNIGFHPTKLPKGRGRGALAWIVLGKVKGAATFFMMEEGMDSGDIIGQHEIVVEENDYVQDVLGKILEGIDVVLDTILAELRKGIILGISQDDEKATYLGQRKPQDGQINWNESATDIHRLIRATSKPLPGAFSKVAGAKCIIQKSSIAKRNKYIGVPGRIMLIKNNRILVACGDGAIWLEEVEGKMPEKIRVGLDLQ